MEKKITKTQNRILMGFTALYIGVLTVNAVMAAIGMDELAVHHYPILFALFILDWASLTDIQRARIIITATQVAKASILITKKAAKDTLCFFRAVRCLPALFARTVKELKEA